MTTPIKDRISATFCEVFADPATGVTLPVLSEDLVLLKSGLDSMGFAVLVIELEGTLGYDPFSISEEAFYPRTFGEFVAFYEKHEPK